MKVSRNRDLIDSARKQAEAGEATPSLGRPDVARSDSEPDEAAPFPPGNYSGLLKGRTSFSTASRYARSMSMKEINQVRSSICLSPTF